MKYNYPHELFSRASENTNANIPQAQGNHNNANEMQAGLGEESRFAKQ